MFYRIRWRTLFTGHQGISATAWPKGLVDKICQSMDDANNGLIVHWAETHEYFLTSEVARIPQEFINPPAKSRWN